jgi:hypothetical protein
VGKSDAWLKSDKLRGSLHEHLHTVVTVLFANFIMVAVDSNQ